MGVCYGPYHWNTERKASEADVTADMDIIAKHFGKIRTYSVHDADTYNVGAASKHGLKVCLGTWIFKNDKTKTFDRMKTFDEIDLAVHQAGMFPGTVIHFIIGNEVDRPEQSYDPKEVLDALNYAKTKKDSHPNKQVNSIPVTTCFSGTVLQPNTPSAEKWLDVVRLCHDVVYLTVYPWYGNSPPDNIDKNMRWSYENGMQQVEALGKRVVIAEIGWPSAGWPPPGEPKEKRFPTTVENEQANYAATNDWVLGKKSSQQSLRGFLVRDV